MLYRVSLNNSRPLFFIFQTDPCFSFSYESNERERERKREKFPIVRTGSTNASQISCSCAEELPRAADERFEEPVTQNTLVCERSQVD